MTCSTCGNENPPEANFCQSCGSDLRVACPNCNTQNPAAAQFCMSCGHRLAVREAAARPAERPPAARMDAEGERRVVTILFVDVKGSTSLAEQLDPEEWTEIIDGAFQRLISAVTRYEGTVARLMGDALLALFGAPVAHEDDAYRAVLAGVDMQTDFAPYRESVLKRLKRREIESEPDDFQIRIGISTGLVVVGIVGSEEKREYTAMGDAVNLASRMEQSAAPGTIQISHDTYRLIPERVEVDALGELAIKGKSRAVRVYRVTGLRQRAPRLRGVSGLSSPLIGRGRELKLINEKLDRLEQGQGQILSLIGEAGLGKSRLLAEVRTSAAVRKILWVEAASLSFEGDHPYGLVRHLLRSVCSCAPDDPPDAVRGKITELLRGLPPEEQRPVSRALDILFDSGTEETFTGLSGRDRQAQLYAGAETIWRVQAGNMPVAIILEDLHWSDSASIDLIRHLFTLTNRAAIFFLCVFRPSRRSAVWGLKQAAEQNFPYRYDEILLTPLSYEDSNELVANLLEAADMPARVVRLILDKAEGNPFFVEELVGELIESKAVLPDGDGWRLAVSIDEIDLPESLEALLVARMDRLEENARQTLQMAAVIGRSFYFRVLKMISEGIESIEDHLSTLESSGMILEAKRMPELEYMFRHGLTQEAAYNTMLLRRRRIFHQRTGEVMETLFADRLEEQAALLTHHFYRAGNAERALHYATLAAEHAARLHANLEAIVHFDKALELVGDATAADEVRIRLLRGRASIYEKLGNFNRALADLESALKTARETDSIHDDWQILLDLGQLWTSRDYERAGRYYEDSLKIARKVAEPAILAASLNRVGNWHANLERPQEGLRYHMEALELLEKSGDDRSLAETNDLLGMANVLAGNLGAGNRYYQHAIELFERLDERFGLISALTTLGYRGPNTRIAFLETHLENALRDGERALELAREIGWRAGEAYACFSLSSLLTSLGEYERALALGSLGLGIAEEIQHRQWMAGAHVTLGGLYGDLLHWEIAEEHLANGVELGKEVGSKNWHYSASSWLAYCLLQHGETTQAADLIEEIAQFKPTTESLSSRIFWWVSAELAIRQDRPEDALEICRRLMSSADWPQDSIVPQIWKTRAAAHISLGEVDRAITLTQEALDRCEMTGERSMAWVLAADLGRYFLRSGRKDDAAAAFQDALERIEGLANSIRVESLRLNFLQRAKSTLGNDG